MAIYRVEFSAHAERILRRIANREPALYRRIASAVEDLGQDPFQGRALKGVLRGRFSYRVGDYRIIYEIRSHELLVLVIDLGHRREIYR